MKSQTIPQLLSLDGSLCTDVKDTCDETNWSYYRNRNEHPILICRHAGGDCDTISWPNPNTRNLCHALFDARETGQIPDVPRVLLPDGTLFNIDQIFEEDQEDDTDFEW